MVVVADASVAIRGDLDPYRRDLKGAERETATFGQKIKNILSPRNVIAGAGLLGIGLGLRQLTGFAGDASAAYSNLMQTTRTVDAVFGDSAGVIEDWAERAAKAAGLSKVQVNEAAAVMGQTLLNMGFNAAEAADQVVLLQQRAADLALAFGKDPQDAMLAITAAMRGERDTIEKFGVSIRQADVNSRVLALGLDTSTAAAKKNAEAIAILDIILNQSASSAGRFADSQDDVAVKMAQSQAQIDNGMAQFGRAVARVQLDTVLAVEATGRELDKFSMHFGDRFALINQIADDYGITWDQAQQKVIAGMEATGESFEIVATSMTRDAQLAAAAMAMEIPRSVRAMQEQLRLGGPVIAAEAGKIAGMLPSEIQARVDDIRRAGSDSVVAFANGLLDDRQRLVDAALGLAGDLEDGLTVAETIAQVTGADVVAALQTGLASNDNGIRLSTQGRLSFIIAELNKLGPAGYAAGVALMAQIGLGITNNAWSGTEAARRAAGNIRAVFPFSEPKDPLSPLRGLRQSGAQIVDFLAEGMLGELGTASAASNALAGALSPSLGGMASGAGGGVPGATGGGGQTFVMNVSGVQREYGTAQDALQGLIDMGAFSDGRL